MCFLVVVAGLFVVAVVKSQAIPSNILKEYQHMQNFISIHIFYRLLINRLYSLASGHSFRISSGEELTLVTRR